MKAIAALLLITAVYLFYPGFDLWVKTDPFVSAYSPEARGFFTLAGCEAEANAMGSTDFRCDRKARWRKVFDTFRQRDPEVRDLQRELGEF